MKGSSEPNGDHNGRKPDAVGLMLAQSTLPERVDLVNQMAHALLFAEAAKTKGLDSRPDIAFQIKWQTMQILMQAYFEQNASKWDMSEKSVRNYYDTHKEEFYQKPGAHTRHILTQTEGDALNAALEVYKTKDFGKGSFRIQPRPQQCE